MEFKLNSSKIYTKTSAILVLNKYKRFTMKNLIKNIKKFIKAVNMYKKKIQDDKTNLV